MPPFNGLELDITRAQELGFSVAQLYMRSDADYIKRAMSDEAIGSFRKTLEASTIEYVIALDPFMKYLGMSEIDRPESMNELIAQELNLCYMLGIPYLIVHPGTCSLRTETLECITDISENINDILEKSSGDSSILLQNMASGGKSIAFTFEHIAQVYRDCAQKNRLGVCFDMCAAFASGYSFGTADEYEAMWKDFDRTIGLEQLKAIHINDSHEDKGSGIISHAYIGKGRIPFESYKLIMNDKRFIDIPKIIEIPITNVNEYKDAYKLLINMINPSLKELYGMG